MMFSIFPTSVHSPLILDTSVLINLHASRHGVQVLTAIPNEILVPDPVAAELENERRRAGGEERFVRSLSEQGIVSRVLLSDKEYTIFEKIVTGTKSLDDGEASAIAVAVSRHGIAVIDERKGRNVAKSLMPDIVPAWSIDLFMHPNVRSKLGEKEFGDAIFLALRNGHMRIHEECCNNVVKIIGKERAIQCTCLPNFKKRCETWRQR